MKRLPALVVLFYFGLTVGRFTLADDAAGPAGPDADAPRCDACVNAASSVSDTETETAVLTDLVRIGPLRERFNADQGVPRAVALLSPVCPGCIKSAELIRSAVLGKYPDTELKLYVVWLPMVPGDARDRWDPDLLSDPRVTHYWNGSRSIGKWFAKNVAECEPLGPIAWDVVYLFGPDATWDGNELHAEFCPTPVYMYPDELAAHSEAWLEAR